MDQQDHQLATTQEYNYLLSAQLSWSHYIELIDIIDAQEHAFYELLH